MPLYFYLETFFMLGVAADHYPLHSILWQLSLKKYLVEVLMKIASCCCLFLSSMNFCIVFFTVKPYMLLPQNF